MSELDCRACGRPLPARTGPGRPAVFCSDACKHKDKRARAAARGKSASAAGSPAGGEKPKRAPRRISAESSQVVRGELLKVVTRELETHDRIDTVDGQQALQLATVLSGFFATATGLASLSQELSRVMDRALAGIATVGDPVDELRALREAKIRELSGKPPKVDAS